MDTQLFIDIIGWAGAFFLLLAYTLVSRKRLQGDSISFQSLNVLGSLLLIANSFYYGAFPSVAVNAIWILIAMIFLSKKLMSNRKTSVSE
jgi:hypothetical protein